MLPSNCVWHVVFYTNIHIQKFIGIEQDMKCFSGEKSIQNLVLKTKLCNIRVHFILRLDTIILDMSHGIREIFGK